MTNHPRTLPRARHCLGALLALSVAPVPAEEAHTHLYECNQGSRVTYSDQPCGSAEKRVDVDYARPEAPQGAATAAAAAALQADRVAEAQLLDTEILNAEQRIGHLQIERDGRIAELRQERYAGTEDLDQQAWQAKMDQRIGAVAAEYQDNIDTEQARLAELQAERAALPPQP
jgi:hypothetical protein